VQDYLNLSYNKMPMNYISGGTLMRYIILLIVIFLAGGCWAADTPAQNPGRVLSTLSGDWGTLWICTPMFKIMRDTPVPASSGSSVRIYAAGNEYEPFQIVLTPKKQLTNVKVTPHTLTGPKGATIPAWSISVKNVEYVNVTEPTDKYTKAGFYPDPLPDQTPFTAPADKNSPIWITVYVPAKTAPGEYKGTVDVTANGIKKLSVPVSLKVWGFALPSVSKLRTAYGNSMWQASSYQGATTPEQCRRLTDLYNLDFFKHRISPYSPYAYYDIKVNAENGNVKLDFTDFDVAIQKFFPLFNTFMLPRFGMWDDLGFKGDDAERMKIDYMRQVAEHLTDKGQLAKGYDYITDEPEESQYGAVIDAAKQVRMADPRIKIMLTEQVEPKLVGSVDIWTPIVPNYDEQRSKARQAAGEEVWWYVCCWPHQPYPTNFIDYPAIDHRILPWISWHYGVNGILYWETCYWQDNPWEIPMSQPSDRKSKWGNGDGHLLYPPVKQKSGAFIDKGPVDSIRWELIREGVEDYDYFSILKNKIDKASADVKSKPAYADAKAALKLVDDCAKSRTEFCRDPEQLEAVRIRIGNAIEGLK